MFAGGVGVLSASLSCPSQAPGVILMLSSQHGYRRPDLGAEDSGFTCSSVIVLFDRLKKRSVPNMVVGCRGRRVLGHPGGHSESLIKTVGPEVRNENKKGLMTCPNPTSSS